MFLLLCCFFLFKKGFLLGALFCSGDEHVFLVNVSLIVGRSPASRTVSNSDFIVFKAPLAAKYPCESGCKRLRSSLLQTFLQNTCFIACRRLAKEDEVVSNCNSFSVSVIVGCWEACGKVYCRPSYACLSAYLRSPDIPFLTQNKGYIDCICLFFHLLYLCLYLIII